MHQDIIEPFSEIIFRVSGKKVDVSKDLDLVAECALDLFDLSEIVVAVEEMFGFVIPDSDIGLFARTSTAAAYIAERLDEIQSWIRKGNE